MISPKKDPDVAKEAEAEAEEEEVVDEAGEDTSTTLLHHHHLNPSNQPTSFVGPAIRKGTDQQIAHLKL
jgi:hypothetical protein